MHMMEKVLDTIRRHHLLDKGESVVAGVSGGPDSVCLLHLLRGAAEQLDIRLYALHVNHRLRGEEALSDERYVQALCAELGIPLQVVSCDIRTYARQRSMSLEEAGREVRYAEFARYAAETGASRIAVAHNRNDQVETVLLNLLRGAGLEGLKGMDYRRGMIIRPLLDVERCDIEAYCRDNGLEPHQDSSNLERDYTRNRVRLDLLPSLNSLFHSGVSESIWRMSSLARIDSEYLEEVSREAFRHCLAAESDREVKLVLEKLKELHEAIRARVLRQGIEKVAGSLKGIGYVHMQELLQLVAKAHTGTETTLPGGINAIVSYGYLRLTTMPAERAETFERLLGIPGRTEVPQCHIRLEASLQERETFDSHLLKRAQDEMIQFFDYEKLKRGIYIRNRRNGDIFKPYRSSGTKKLKEYFIDNKVPREKRDAVPLVAQEHEIVWIIGQKISDKFKVTENTKMVLCLKVLPLEAASSISKESQGG